MGIEYAEAACGGDADADADADGRGPASPYTDIITRRFLRDLFWRHLDSRTVNG